MNIFGVTFTRMTGLQIVKENSYYRNKNGDFYQKYQALPSYVIRDNSITESDGCFQFYTGSIGEMSKEKQEEEFILFDITMTDSIISEEISAVDGDDFLENICFAEFFNEHKDKLLIHDFNERVNICMEQCFVVEMHSWVNSGPDGDDYDYEINLVGYLDHNMNLVKG